MTLPRVANLSGRMPRGKQPLRSCPFSRQATLPDTRLPTMRSTSSAAVRSVHGLPEETYCFCREWEEMDEIRRGRIDFLRGIRYNDTIWGAAEVYMAPRGKNACTAGSL